MLVNVIPGKSYAVTAQAECTVTCEHQGRTYTLCAVSSGAQAYFVSPIDTVTVSDDTALVTETFNLAPQQKLALLGVLGGGTPAWLKMLETELTAMLDGSQFETAWLSAEKTLVVHTDRVRDELLAAVKATAEAAMPEGAVLVQYNHHIEISWRDINKYAECVSYVDLYNVNPDYGNDLTSDGEWVYPLPNLVTASDFAPNSLNPHEKCRFAYNTKLKKWNVDLPKAKSVTNMFRAASLNEFNGALPVVSSMDNGENKMFGGKGLQIFRSSNCGIQNGTKWFWYCESLHTFDADLSKLYNGYHMLAFAILNKKSALRIFNSIPAFTSGSHPLSIGIHVDHKTDEEVLAAIANAEAKGWTLTVQWNGTATASAAATYGLRGPLVYARVVEENGERMLDWGHYVTDPTGYEEFRSVEAAREYFGIEE